MIGLKTTEKWDSPQEAKHAWKNSSHGFIELLIRGYERCHTTDAP